MKKILFMLIVLLCSMSTNAQTMKVMKGDQVVATYSSTQANEVVFGVSDGVFSVTYKLGSVSEIYDDNYEVTYPSTTNIACYLVKKDKDIATMDWIFATPEDFKEYIDLENASDEEIKAFVMEYGNSYNEKRVNNMNNEGDRGYWSGLTPNTEYTLILYATSVEADEYVAVVKYTTAAEAPTTTGTAKRTGDVDVNWVQLWENGPKFAEYNVGAENNKAEDYGGYYAWGGSIDQDSNAKFNWGTDALTGTDDTASNLWGSAWRMPTQEEFQALLDNCDVEWTTVNDVYGRKFTGKGDYASNSVFLPAAGFCNYGSVGGQGSRGDYWCSTPFDSGPYAYFLEFNSSSQSVKYVGRDMGFSVRAVLVEK